jgi:hypothetical protein
MDKYFSSLTARGTILRCSPQAISLLLARQELYHLSLSASPLSLLLTLNSSCRMRRLSAFKGWARLLPVGRSREGRKQGRCQGREATQSTQGHTALHLEEETF